LPKRSLEYFKFLSPHGNDSCASNTVRRMQSHPVIHSQVFWRIQLIRICGLLVAVALIAVAVVVPVSAQQAGQPIDPSLYSGMRWRLIGPHRGGRVSAVAGIPGDPATYYMGTPGGGIWKTTDSGEVWTPIFDQERVASIGALAIAPSNPAIIYAPASKRRVTVYTSPQMRAQPGPISGCKRRDTSVRS
jgi:hypothetical protein